MEVVNSLGDGVEHSAGLSLREELLPEDPVQQLPALHQLRHQVHVPALVIHLRRSSTRGGQMKKDHEGDHTSKRTNALR